MRPNGGVWSAKASATEGVGSRCAGVLPETRESRAGPPLGALQPRVRAAASRLKGAAKIRQNPPGPGILSERAPDEDPIHPGGNYSSTLSPLSLS